MKPHLRRDRGVWTCRLCMRVYGAYHSRRFAYIATDRIVGHGYTVREACEDWKAQMQAQRA